MKHKLLIVQIISVTFPLILFSQNNSLYIPDTSASCDNYIDIGNLSISGNTLTVEATIYLEDDNPNCDVTESNDIVSKHYNNTDVNYLLRPDHAEINTSSGFYTTSVVPISRQACHHVAMVYNGSYLKFFRDDSFVDSVAVSGDMVLNSYETKIGDIAHANPFHYEQYWGYIDEVRIWYTSRTQSQLAEYAFTTLPDPAGQPGLLAYYDFQDGYTNLQGDDTYDGTAVGQLFIKEDPESCVTEAISSAESLANHISIFPNPATSFVHVQFDRVQDPAGNIIVCDYLGRVVQQQKIAGDYTEINLKSLKPGLYFISVQLLDGEYLYKKLEIM